MDCRWAVEGKEVLSRKQRRPQKPEPHKPRRNHLQYTHTVFWRWSGPVRVRCCVLTHTHRGDNIAVILLPVVSNLVMFG